MSIEDTEMEEMPVEELIDIVEEDDIPTSEFTVEDTDRMVILGKLNTIIEWLKTHGYGTNIFSDGEYLESYNIDLKLDKSTYDTFILALDEILQDIATALEDIPTKTSELDNDSGFITLSDIPTIPTKTSELDNDSGFITDSYHDNTKQDVLTFDDTPTENSNNPVKSSGIYNAINREFIEAYTQSEIKLTANTWTNVGSNANLTVINSNGNKLSMNTSSRRIIIGNGVSKVKIYAKARFYCNTTNTRFQVALYKNGASANAYVDYGSADCKMQYVQYPVNFTCIVDVNENDELSFSVISSQSNSSNKDGLQLYSTFIVEVIK